MGFNETGCSQSRGQLAGRGSACGRRSGTVSAQDYRALCKPGEALRHYRLQYRDTRRAGAQDAGTTDLTILRGVYFLGSAVTRDTTINRKHLPADLRITNYHSPRWDIVHHTAFSFMNREDAGGSVGFAHDTLFENLQVSSTHMHKEVGVPLDYSQLAIGIGYRALDDVGVRLHCRTRFNLKTSVGQGDLWWNRIMQRPARAVSRTTSMSSNNMRSTTPIFAPCLKSTATWA